MITYIILLLICFYFYTIKETFTINKKKKEKNRQLIKDTINIHINKVNSEKFNKNIFQPTKVLPYNLNNTDEYNILNNYGIKNMKKRILYTNKINKCNTIPYNKTNLFKNYDKILDTSFSDIKLNNTNVQNCKNENLKNIVLISKDSTFQWSYDTNLLNNKFFYIYYTISDTKCNLNSKTYNSLKLNNDSNFNEFSFNKHHYKNRNIYKMEFLEKKKACELFIVLKENNKILLKSNNIIIQN